LLHIPAQTAHGAQFPALARGALTLGHCQIGEPTKITAIQADVDLKQRMAALGLREGCTVSVLRKASLGGPVQVRVGTTEVIMRLNEANRIVVMPLPN
jgi:ferrous iron transport protein A